MDGDKIELHQLEDNNNNDDENNTSENKKKDSGPFAIDPALNLKKAAELRASNNNNNTEPDDTNNNHQDAVAAAAAAAAAATVIGDKNDDDNHNGNSSRTKENNDDDDYLNNTYHQIPTTTTAAAASTSTTTSSNNNYPLDMLTQQSSAQHHHYHHTQQQQPPPPPPHQQPHPSDIFQNSTSTPPPINSNKPITTHQPPAHLLQPLIPVTGNRIVSQSSAVSSSSSPNSTSAKKRKASAISSMNSNNGGHELDPDSDLKRQAQGCIQLPIDSLVGRVRELDQGPSGEKTKQLFGMTWLLKNCQLSMDDNVPRNRIYARYVELCTEYDLKPLNPASFGKLVRSLFPGIKTRRLGVRGQSKYHYCGIRLIGDQNKATGNTPTGTPGRLTATNSPGPTSAGAGDVSFNSPYSSTSTTPLNHRFNNNNSKVMNNSNNTPLSGTELDPKISEFMHAAPNTQQHPLSNNTTTNDATNNFQPFDQQQSFNSDDNETSSSLFNDMNDISLSSVEGFSIPPIEAYYDTSIDPDSATTLYGLYRSHCRSLIEALRFMHIKKFLNIQGSLIGSLTAPVQKLLKDEGIINWVKAVDWITYKEMVQLLSPLALQDVPAEVLQGLRSLCQFLPGHLTNILNNQPPEFLQAKLVPANAFVGLVDRLLRANETAQSAGKMLVNSEEIEKMKTSWINFVDSKAIVAREIPCASNEVVKILQYEVIHLLLTEDDDGSKAESNKTNSKSEAAIVKWAQYLSSLPKRFPNVPTRLFLLCVSSILKATLRDIGFNGGNGFGAWWVVQCWIDEWMGWTAEMGGFLSDENTDNTPPTIMNNNNDTNNFLAGLDGRVKLMFPNATNTNSTDNNNKDDNNGGIDDNEE